MTAPMTTEEPLLELRNASKIYGPNRAVDHVSFTVGRGEIVGLLGDNGAGKSTLVKMLSGVVPLDEGRYFWDGEDLGRPSRSETETRGVETIFQDSALVDDMTITRNIFMGREITNPFGLMRLREMDDISNEILKSVVTIEGIRSPRQLVGSLSGGQKQAVAIARAVHFQRSVLILDEPTSALAVRATEALLAYLVHLRDQGVTSILVTHNLHHAFQVCDRHIVMNHGQKILDVCREDTSVEELTAAVVEGRMGLERYATASAPVAVAPRAGEISSLHAAMLQSGQEPTTEVLRCEVTEADAEVAQALAVNDGQPVLAIERIRSGAEGPVAIMRNWLTVGTDGSITSDHLRSGSLYQRLVDLGVKLGPAHQVLGGRLASDGEADRLGLARGSSVITVRRVLMDDSETPIEFAKHVYDLVKYAVESTIPPPTEP